MQVTVSHPSESGSDYSNRFTVSTPNGKPVGVIVESKERHGASVEQMLQRWRDYGFIEKDHLEQLFDIATEDSPIRFELVTNAQTT